jgi:hypothetical protein
MLLTHFIWQTDLKQLSGTNAKNGAITPSLTPTMHIIHARCYKASEWVGGESTSPEPFASYGTSTVTRTSGRGHVAEA